MRRFSIALLTASALFAGCFPAYYPTYPVSVTSPANFDRSWDAALGAANDVGVEVTLADRSTGRITGIKAGAAVTIVLQPQADGSLRVTFSAPDAKEENPTLQDRWVGAYNRRMGR